MKVIDEHGNVTIDGIKALIVGHGFLDDAHIHLIPEDHLKAMIEYMDNLTRDGWDYGSAFLRVYDRYFHFITGQANE